MLPLGQDWDQGTVRGQPHKSPVPRGTLDLLPGLRGLGRPGNMLPAGLSLLSRTVLHAAPTGTRGRPRPCALTRPKRPPTVSAVISSPGMSRVWLEGGGWADPSGWSRAGGPGTGPGPGGVRGPQTERRYSGPAAPLGAWLSAWGGHWPSPGPTETPRSQCRSPGSLASWLGAPRPGLGAFPSLTFGRGFPLGLPDGGTPDPARPVAHDRLDHVPPAWPRPMGAQQRGKALTLPLENDFKPQAPGGPFPWNIGVCSHTHSGVPGAGVPGAGAGGSRPSSLGVFLRTQLFSPSTPRLSRCEANVGQVEAKCGTVLRRAGPPGPVSMVP